MRLALGIVVLLVLAQRVARRSRDAPNETRPARSTAAPPAAATTHAGGGTQVNGVDASTDNGARRRADQLADRDVADFHRRRARRLLRRGVRRARSRLPGDRAVRHVRRRTFRSSVSDACTTGSTKARSAPRTWRPGDVTNGKGCLRRQRSPQACLCAGITHYAHVRRLLGDTARRIPPRATPRSSARSPSGGTCNSAFECADVNADCQNQVCAVAN